MDLREYIAPDLLEKFEFYSYNHALEIITQAFPAEWSEIVDCLRQLRITTDDLRESGGNETKIPKKLMMCCIPADGARSAFPATSTSSSTRGRPNSGDAFPRSRLRKGHTGISTDIISTS